ncbi:MAG: hypothetical protein PWQ12_2013 [Clostridiales bacterium]|nr:hypothetical protein [Clostridiales bacterium]
MKEEMMCSMVQDLLPSYIEKLTSDETNAVVAQHLSTCENCRKAYEQMIADVGDAEKVPAIELNFLKKLKHKQIIGAVLSAVITLLCLFGLYNMAFSIDVTNTRSLEASIDEYFFSDGVDANIIESQRVGNQLIVFFEREGYAGHYGLATLEAGIFGKYRFLSANLDDWPLYEYTFGNGKKYLLLYGINDLQGVATYAIYPSDDTAAQPIYQGVVESTPFLRIIKPENAERYVGKQFVHYYDANGNEISVNTLWHEVPQPDEGRTPGVGSAELGLIYVNLVIVLIVGIVFVRYFLKP